MREYHKRAEEPEEGTVSDFDRPVVPVGCLFQGRYNPAFADKRRYPLHESVKEV